MEKKNKGLNIKVTTKNNALSNKTRLYDIVVSSSRHHKIVPSLLTFKTQTNIVIQVTYRTHCTQSKLAHNAIKY